MPEAAGNGGGGSDVGSPAAGAVAPARLSDLGGASHGTQTRSLSMSDLGTVGTPTGPGAAAPGEKMTPIGDTPWGADKPTAQPEQVDEQAIDPNAPPPEAEAEGEPQTPATLTPEQQAAKYAEWMDSDQIPEEFLDRPIWIPDGKNGQVPVMLRDIPNNVLLYNDYQKKTTEVAQMRRQNEAYAQGRQRWINDMTSGDPEAGLRAIRGIGADKTLEQIVIKFVQNMAQLEGLPPNLRQQFIEGQQARDRAYYAEQQLQMIQQQQQAQMQQEQQQAGVNSPDIQYVQDSITRQIPEIYKQLNITENPLVEHLLSAELANAATGVRDPQTGQYITPPSIQLGRAPTRELLTQLVLAAKQKADSYVSGSGRKVSAPPTKPLQGSGPAAKPGQRGNLSAPAQARFSDLATGRRSG
jgi:hypothetical protein